MYYWYIMLHFIVCIFHVKDDDGVWCYFRWC